MNKKTIYIIISGVIIALGLVIPSPEQFTDEGFKCLFLIAGVLILWLTEAFPLGISSVLLTAAIPLLGIMTPGDTWKAFISSVFFFVMATYAISVAIMNTPLAQRISRFFLKRAGSNSNMIILGFMLGTAFLSAIMSNVPVCALFTGLAAGILEDLGAVPKESRLGRAIMIAVPFAAMAGGMATPAGSSVNILALYWMEETIGKTIPFVNWMIVGIPLCAVFVVIMWWVIIKLYRPEKIEGEFVEKAIESMDIPVQITPIEKKVCAVIGGMVILWILSSWISAIDLTVVAMMGLVVFMMPGMNIFTWKQYSEEVSWEALLVIGSVTAMGGAVINTGLGNWLVNNFLKDVASMGFLSFAIILALVINWVHLPLPIAPSIVAITVAPVITAVCEIGMNPATFIIATIASGCYLLPIDAVPLISYSKGYYTFTDMFKSGAVVSTILCILVPLWTYVVGNLL